MLGEDSMSAAKSRPWARQQLQLPDNLGRLFRERVSVRSDGGVKIMGAAAIAAYLALPEETRLRIEAYVLQQEWLGLDIEIDALRPAMAGAVFPAVGRQAEKPTDRIPTPGDTHQVDRILDPRISLPPGHAARKAKGA